MNLLTINSWTQIHSHTRQSSKKSNHQNHSLLSTYQTNSQHIRSQNNPKNNSMVQDINALPPLTTTNKPSILTFFLSIYCSNNTITKLNFFSRTYTIQFNYTKHSYHTGILFLKSTKIPYNQTHL
jgi:hypothetical protein